jgi:twitching motility protein PilU
LEENTVTTAPVRSGPQAAVEADRNIAKILPYLRLASEKKASDLFFSAGAPVAIKIDGTTMPAGRSALSAEQVRELVMSVLTPSQQETLKEKLELDLAIDVPEAGRFRVNAFQQRGSLAMALRLVQARIPTLEELRMPEVLKSLIMHRRGLILMVGATGSGKSTTLAAMLSHRNGSETGHLLTIEDPIEFLHPNKMSVVNQREIGLDTHSFETALHSAFREAPDVILVGEARSRETMQACLQLATVGHLTLATLHATNAAQALQRVINFFPEEARDQIYMDLSMSLRAIISQRLVRRKDGGRCAAIEIMLNTPFISELILNKRISEVREAMSQSSEKGMQTFDDSLLALYRSGEISMDEALSNADSSPNLQAKIAFGG